MKEPPTVMNTGRAGGVSELIDADKWSFGGLIVDNRSGLREVLGLRLDLRVSDGDLERPACGEP
jgi:hypothetical protein